MEPSVLGSVRAPALNDIGQMCHLCDASAGPFVLCQGETWSDKVIQIPRKALFTGLQIMASRAGSGKKSLHPE